MAWKIARVMQSPAPSSDTKGKRRSPERRRARMAAQCTRENVRRKIKLDAAPAADTFSTESAAATLES